MEDKLGKSLMIHEKRTLKITLSEKQQQQQQTTTTQQAFEDN